ncbi:hypothetical protein GQ53DRAFT_819403 [Thozetella sp. PMI_491]|nr:hypothetical protein GQ53DRAFT_819403 [Thozetella sp. PMI_491]
MENIGESKIIEAGELMPSLTAAKKGQQWNMFTCIHIYIFLLHVIVLVGVVVLPICKPGTVDYLIEHKRSWSPVNKFVEFEANGDNALDHSKHSKYSGPPSTEQEHAWDDLMRPLHFRASREELLKAGEDLHNAVELADGGYIAVLGVYHELHCLVSSPRPFSKILCKSMESGS